MPHGNPNFLLINRIDKPGLLRQLFRHGCNYSSQILSHQKVVGQLPDAWNTTTTHYLELLTGAGMLCGLQKFVGERYGSTARVRVADVEQWAYDGAKGDPTSPDSPRSGTAGRSGGSSIGPHLANGAQMGEYELSYGREVLKVVDFVLRRRENVRRLR